MSFQGPQSWHHRNATQALWESGEEELLLAGEVERFLGSGPIEDGRGFHGQRWCGGDLQLGRWLSKNGGQNHHWRGVVPKLAEMSLPIEQFILMPY